MANTVFNPDPDIEDDVIDRLKLIMQEKPSDTEYLRWAYAIFTYPDIEGLLLLKTKSAYDGRCLGQYSRKVKLPNPDSYDFPLSCIEFPNVVRTSNIYLEDFIRAIKAVSEQSYAHFRDISELDALGTERYLRWAEAFQRDIKLGSSTHCQTGEMYYCLFEFEKITSHQVRLTGKINYIADGQPNAEVYRQHQHITLLKRHFDNSPLNVVMDYVNRRKKKSLRAQMESFNPKQIKIPVLDNQAVSEKAEALEPLSFPDISGFGVALETEASHAMAQLSSYFLYNAQRAAKTVECIEASMEDIRAIDPSIIVQDDPSGWWGRKFTRVRLVQPEDMPLMKLVEKFSKLPDYAAQDNAAYQSDLEIVDHAIKVSGAYHNILLAHHDALAAQQQRLLVADNVANLPEDIARAGIPNIIEQRLNSLKLSARLMTLQAANFGSIANVIAANRNQLGKISGMAAAIQIPALDAVRKFQLYQFRRMQIFGHSVDDKTKIALGLNDDAFERSIDVTPQIARDSMSTAMQGILDDFERLRTAIIAQDEKPKAIASEIKRAAIRLSSEDDDGLQP
jgi:hypothetical protein